MANRTVPRRRRYRGPLAVIAGTAVTAAALTAITWSASPAGAAVISPFDIAGRGATVPFAEVEAENAGTNGTSTGTSRYYGRLSSEASGREAVTLDAAGEYVEFTLPRAANAMFRHRFFSSYASSSQLAPGVAYS